MKKSQWIACSAIAALVLGAGAAWADDNTDEGARNSIQGTWEVILTLRLPADDCTTSPLIGVGLNPVPSFNTFHEGGTMSEFGVRSPAARRSAGHGVWDQVGRRRFAYHVAFFRFDGSDLFTGRIDIRSTMTLAADGQTLTGVGRLVQTGLSGTTEVNACVTLEGTRMSL